LPPLRAPENSVSTYQWVDADPDLPKELAMSDPVHLQQQVSLIAECHISFIIHAFDVVDRSSEIVPASKAAIPLRRCVQNDFPR
jgi:hypothetical protein